MPFSFLYFRCCRQSAMNTYSYRSLNYFSKLTWCASFTVWSIAQNCLYKNTLFKIRGKRSCWRSVWVRGSCYLLHWNNNKRPHNVSQAPRIPKSLHSCLVEATVQRKGRQFKKEDITLLKLHWEKWHSEAFFSLKQTLIIQIAKQRICIDETRCSSQIINVFIWILIIEAIAKFYIFLSYS